MATSLGAPLAQEYHEPRSTTSLGAHCSSEAPGAASSVDTSIPDVWLPEDYKFLLPEGPGTRCCVHNSPAHTQRLGHTSASWGQGEPAGKAKKVSREVSRNSLRRLHF